MSSLTIIPYNTAKARQSTASRSKKCQKTVSSLNTDISLQSKSAGREVLTDGLGPISINEYDMSSAQSIQNKTYCDLETDQAPSADFEDETQQSSTPSTISKASLSTSPFSQLQSPPSSVSSTEERYKKAAGQDSLTEAGLHPSFIDIIEEDELHCIDSIDIPDAGEDDEYVCGVKADWDGSNLNGTSQVSSASSDPTTDGQGVSNSGTELDNRDWEIQRIGGVRESDGVIEFKVYWAPTWEPGKNLGNARQSIDAYKKRRQARLASQGNKNKLKRRRGVDETGLQ